jgi:hypothetical protein
MDCNTMLVSTSTFGKNWLSPSLGYNSSPFFSTEKTETSGLFKMSAVFTAHHEMAPLLSRSDDVGNRILWKRPFTPTSLHGVTLQITVTLITKWQHTSAVAAQAV